MHHNFKLRVDECGEGEKKHIKLHKNHNFHYNLINKTFFSVTLPGSNVDFAVNRISYFLKINALQ